MYSWPPKVKGIFPFTKSRKSHAQGDLTEIIKAQNKSQNRTWNGKQQTNVTEAPNFAKKRLIDKKIRLILLQEMTI